MWEGNTTRDDHELGNTPAARRANWRSHADRFASRPRWLRELRIMCGE